MRRVLVIIISLALITYSVLKFDSMATTGDDAGNLHAGSAKPTSPGGQGKDNLDAGKADTEYPLVKCGTQVSWKCSRPLDVDHDRTYFNGFSTRMLLGRGVEQSDHTAEAKIRKIHDKSARPSYHCGSKMGDPMQMDFSVNDKMVEAMMTRMDTRRGNNMVLANFRLMDMSRVLSYACACIGKYVNDGSLTNAQVTGGRNDFYDKNTADVVIMPRSGVVYLPRVSGNEDDEATFWT